MLAALALACAGGPTVVNETGTLVLDLVNPTEADPWEGVDSVVIELLVDGKVVETARFDVEDEAELPGLEHFGTGRFTVAGVAGSSVVSFGRSAEILLAPGLDLTVPVTFLPVNQVLPVSDEMASARSDHGSMVLPDGRVLLVGGRSPASDDGYDELELYDPHLGAFVPTGSYLPAPMFGMQVQPGHRGEVFLVGGYSILGGNIRREKSFIAYDPISGLVDLETAMTAPRAGGCFSEFRENFGVFIGGTSETLAIDYLRPDPDDGEWTWSDVVIGDLDQEAVTGCAALPTGELFLQGLSLESTGLFDFSEDAASSNPNIGDAFYPVTTGELELISGGLVVPLVDKVWVGAGKDKGGVALTSGRLFELESRSFVGGVDPSRPRVDGSWDAWIEDGWVVLGCGSPDGSLEKSQTTLELLNLISGDRYPYLEADRSRPGCKMNVLHDGSILLTGGFVSGDEGLPSAAIAVPYNPG